MAKDTERRFQAVMDVEVYEKLKTMAAEERRSMNFMVGAAIETLYEQTGSRQDRDADERNDQ